MKELNEFNLPEDIRHSEDHEYAYPVNDRYRVGINDYAQDQPGDIVYVELPAVGDRFEKGNIKEISDIIHEKGGQVCCDGAMMIEPTETESEEEIDQFIKACRDIAAEAKVQADLLLKSPHHAKGLYQKGIES